MVSRGLPATLAYLDALERLWVPERARLVADLRAQGEALESGHWNWRNKAVQQPHWHTLVAIECEGETQGIMAVENLLRRSQLNPPLWVLYVDYLEIAPWNVRVPLNRASTTVRAPRFTRVGTLLLGEAIRMSLGASAGGRVGLHALPQSEDFYTRCGMTRVGPDPNYHDLVYFEYADDVAAAQLTALELSA